LIAFAHRRPDQRHDAAALPPRPAYHGPGAATMRVGPRGLVRAEDLPR
jgi:hypothetical protein